MARLHELRDALTPIVGMLPATVDRTLRKLQDAGMLPDSTASEITRDHAATLLLALIGARSPGEAVEVVEAYSALPARGFLTGKPAVGGMDTRLTPIEDTPIIEGAGDAWNGMTRNFRSSLSVCIQAIVDSSDAHIAQLVTPRLVTIRRDPLRPWASITLGYCAADPEAVRMLVFCAPGEAHGLYPGNILRMNVTTALPGLVLRVVADLIAGRDPIDMDAPQPEDKERVR